MYVSIVTPLAGVWIEIPFILILSVSQYRSLPSRECGLKFRSNGDSRSLCPVTPLAGVWIEIYRSG